MQLQALTKVIPVLKDADFSKIELQKLDGWSNHNYLFSLNDKKYILRLPVVSAEEGINRQAEFYNTKCAAEAGIFYSYTYFDENTGISLREFIEGHAPTNEEGKMQADDLSSIAMLFKKLHNLPQPFVNEVNNFLLIENTVKHLKQYQADSVKDFESLLLQMNSVKDCLANKQVITVPCHNDQNPRNFLRNGKKMLLLDWEYSGNSDPAWDLAYFIAHGDLDEKSEKLLLDHYYSGQVPHEDYRRIILYKPLTLLIFSLWIRLQRIKGHFPVSLEELIYWEGTLNQEISTFFLSDQHQQALKALK